MSTNGQTRTTTALHHGNSGERRPAKDVHVCDFAWEFGGSSHDWHLDGEINAAQDSSRVLSHLDRALALAG